MILSLLDFERGQIINIDKPRDWTSFDVVKKIRGYIRPAKVGHAGTLDPFATGVLLICTGKATKKVQELMNLDKEYLGKIEFGKTTDTFDVTGKVLKENDCANITLDKAKEACEHFNGEIEQIPPMYSAVKVNGERLYKKARRGETVKREPRKVHIYKIEVIDFKNPFLELKVVCSKGTYIRALANDMGELLGCGALLKKLRRTRIGQYKIEEAHSIQEFVQTVKRPVIA